MKKLLISATISSILLATGCTEQASTMNKTATTQTDSAKAEQTNPLFMTSSLTYGAPQFDLIKDEHFIPAFEKGMEQHLQEVEKIASNPDAPTFDNTLLALEKSGSLLTRTSRVFFNLVGTDSSPERREIQKILAPKLAAHSDTINLNSALFKRIETLYNQRDALELDTESIRLLEEYYSDFVRAGAKLNESDKQKIREINEEHSTLTTQFSQNLLAESSEIAVVVNDVEQLSGMSERQIKAASDAAKAADKEGKYLLRITNTTRQPVLTSLENRALRQQVWEASAYRNQSGVYDNTKIISRLAGLRAQKAALLGFDSWAAYSLDKQMAGSPSAVYDMLGSMVPAVLKNVEKEAADIKAMIEAEGNNFELKPWDWAFYAEKVRQAK